MSFCSESIINKKFLCPICWNEVKEYPQTDILRGKFKCLSCSNIINLKKTKRW